MKKAIVSLLVGLMTIGGVNSVVKAETSSKNEVENKVEIIAVKDNTQKEAINRIVISCISAWLLSVITLTGSVWGWLIGFANDNSVKGLVIGSVIGFVALLGCAVAGVLYDKQKVNMSVASCGM